MSITELSTVKALINALKLSQRKFANETGISKEALNQYATGTRQLTANAAIKICTRFSNVNFDWLMTGQGEMFKPDFEGDKDKELSRLIEDNKRLIEELARERKINDGLLKLLLKEPPPLGEKEPD